MSHRTALADDRIRQGETFAVELVPRIQGPQIRYYPEWKRSSFAKSNAIPTSASYTIRLDDEDKTPVRASTILTPANPLVIPIETTDTGSSLREHLVTVTSVMSPTETAIDVFTYFVVENPDFAPIPPPVIGSGEGITVDLGSYVSGTSFHAMSGQVTNDTSTPVAAARQVMIQAWLDIENAFLEDSVAHLRASGSTVELIVMQAGSGQFSGVSLGGAVSAIVVETESTGAFDFVMNGLGGEDGSVYILAKLLPAANKFNTPPVAGGLLAVELAD